MDKEFPASRKYEAEGELRMQTRDGDQADADWGNTANDRANM